MPEFSASRDGANFLNHVHAFDYFTKYTVTPATGVFATEVQETVVCNVDKELAGC